MLISAAKTKPAYADLITRRKQDVLAQAGPIFAGATVYTLEIGAGHGHFLTAFAEHFPGRLCVGLDIAAERVERAGRKRDRSRAKNLHFLHSEARLFLECVPPHAKVETLFILFPDPWPKSKHHKHRLFNAQLLAQLRDIAVPGCRIYFRTDHLPYFEAALATVAASPDWDVVAEPWLFEYSTVFQQRAERYYSAVIQRRA